MRCGVDSRATAVLCDGHVIVGAHTRSWQRTAVASPDLASLETMAVWADSVGVSQVWIMGPTGPTANPAWWRVTRPRVAHATGPDGTATAALVQRQYHGTSGNIYVHDLTYNDAGTRRDTRWPWAGEMAAPTVLASALAAASALDWPLSYSPGHSGLALLQRLSAGHTDWLTYPAGDLAHGLPVTHPANHWYSRDAAVRPRAWLHAYDVRAAYLAAAARVNLGCGELVAAEDWRAAGQHGVYHVDAEPGAVLLDGGWYDRAALVAARCQGQPFTVDAGWRFAAYHRPLEAWARRIWAAREATDGLAREAIKAVYVAAIGSFGRAGTAHSRPLWHAAIVAEAARHAWANLAGVAAYGETPIGLRVDAVYALSDAPAPAAAQPARLGGLRHTGSYRVTPDLGRVLTNGNLRDLVRWIGRQEGA